MNLTPAILRAMQDRASFLRASRQRGYYSTEESDERLRDEQELEHALAERCKPCNQVLDSEYAGYIPAGWWLGDPDEFRPDKCLPVHPDSQQCMFQFYNSGPSAQYCDFQGAL